MLGIVAVVLLVVIALLLLFLCSLIHQVSNQLEGTYGAVAGACQSLLSLRGHSEEMLRFLQRADRLEGRREL